MRAGLSSNSSTKETPVSKKVLAAPQHQGIDEVFSPPRLGGVGSKKLDLAPDDLPSSKQDFAASVAREARTSTLRAPSSSSSALRASQTPANTSSLSYPSPDLPSFAPGSELPLHRRRPASSSSGSLRSGNSTRAGSPALSVATSGEKNEGEVTLGAVTRGLRLPEMEEEAERRQAPVPKEKERARKVKMARVGVEEVEKVAKMAKGEAKVGCGTTAPSEREAPKDVAQGLLKAGSRRVARRHVINAEDDGAKSEEAEDDSQGRSAGVRTDLLKSAVREVMDEYSAK